MDKSISRADCKTSSILIKVSLWPFWPASGVEKHGFPIKSCCRILNFRVNAAIFDKAPPSHHGITFGATTGSVDEAGERLWVCAIEAGAGSKTKFIASAIGLPGLPIKWILDLGLKLDI